MDVIFIYSLGWMKIDMVHWWISHVSVATFRAMMLVQALIQQLLQCPNKAKEARDAKFFWDPASLVMENHWNVQKWP